MVKNLEMVSKILKVFINKKGFLAYKKWRPFSVTSFLLAEELKKYSPDFKTIIDGGANIGQFARAALETFPAARVISFEPLPDIVEKLKKNLSDCKDRISLVQFALGRKTGNVVFNRNAHSHSSSALQLHPNHKAAFPKALPTEKLRVRMTTLDKALKREKLVGPVLLKLDLQGYELEALKGASQTLKKVDAVLLETSLKPMYQGEPTFKEIEKFLKSKGFRFVKALDYLRDSKGTPLQMDALFIRKNQIA